MLEKRSINRLSRRIIMETKDIDLAQLRIDRSAQATGPSRRPRRWRRFTLWGTAVVILAAGFLFFKEFFNSGIEVQLATVSLTSPSLANSVLTASGYVVARRKAAVASKGTGTLVYLAVEEGDRVKKGQVIARLDDSDVMASLKRARENLRVAEADLDDAKKNYDRMRAVIGTRAISQADYDAAEARYKRVISTIEAAK